MRVVCKNWECFAGDSGGAHCRSGGHDVRRYQTGCSARVVGEGIGECRNSTQQS